MAVKAFPALGRFLFARLGEKRPSALHLETEAKIANLSEPARIALWHHAQHALTGPNLDEVLREARVTANVNAVLAELSQAGLTDHHFSGTQFVNARIARSRAGDTTDLAFFRPACEHGLLGDGTSLTRRQRGRAGFPALGRAQGRHRDRVRVSRVGWLRRLR